jgi:outer membrane protein TolC
MAEERFALGIISSLDLDRTRQQHIRAESELVDRFYRLVKHQEELNFLRSDKILGLW